jgi:hypothetical protein
MIIDNSPQCLKTIFSIPSYYLAYWEEVPGTITRVRKAPNWKVVPGRDFGYS